MKTILLGIIISFLASVNVFAGEADFKFEKANKQYQEENFTKAIKIYNEILESGMISGKLCYNLGNAYYKNGEIGKAIQFYEKAKLLMPGNESVEFNLKLVNVKVKDRIQVPPDTILITIHKKLINIFSLQTWSIIFSLCLFLSSIMFFIGSLIPGFKTKLNNSMFGFIMAALIMLYPVLSKYNTEQLVNKGVLVNSRGEVFAAPDSESTKLFTIHEGTLFHILNSDGNWYKIELIDGKQGWLHQSMCGKI